MAINPYEPPKEPKAAPNMKWASIGLSAMILLPMIQWLVNACVNWFRGP